MPPDNDHPINPAPPSAASAPPAPSTDSPEEVAAAEDGVAVADHGGAEEAVLVEEPEVVVDELPPPPAPAPSAPPPPPPMAAGVAAAAAPASEGADTFDEESTVVVDEPEVVEDTEVLDARSPAPAPEHHAHPPAPPPAALSHPHLTPHHAPPPPPAPVPAPAPATDGGASPSGEMAESPAPPPASAPAPAPLPLGALESAIEAARAARTPEGPKRRIALYEAELAALAAQPQGGDRARVALLQHEIGEILEDIGDEGAAVKAYAKALQSDPSLRPNLWAIRRVFQERQLWPNLQKLIDAEIRYARGDAERAELLVEKGQLLEDRLGQPAEALACYEKAVATDPKSIAGWMALEKIAIRDGDLGGIARATRGLADATAEPGRKVALLLDLARMQEAIVVDRGAALDAALALCREALAVDHEPERVLDVIERLAEAAGRTDELLAAVAARLAIVERRQGELPLAERLAESDRVVALRRRESELYRELAAKATSDEARAAAFERAAAALEAALRIQPEEPLLLLDQLALAEARGRHEEVAALLGRRVAGVPQALRAGLLLDRADALRRADRAADAEAVENDVAREAPGHVGLHVARERRAIATGDWERLAQLALVEAAAQEGEGAEADPQWAAAACLTAATVLGDRLGRVAEAEAALARALALRPGWRPTIDALERLYRRAGATKATELAQLLERELEAAAASGDGQRQERLLDELITVREALGDLGGAAAAARRITALRPDELRGWLRLAELDRAAGRWAELVDDLARVAQLVSEERRVEVLVERAEVIERRVLDEAAAARAWKEILLISPGEPRAVEAFELLSRRLSGRGTAPTGESAPAPAAWDDLAAALEREAEASLSPERQTRVLLRLAEVHERERGRADDAARVYRQVLEKTPGSGAALRGLDRVLGALGDQAARAAAIAEEIEGLSTASSRAARLVTLGELYEDTLRRDDEADEAYGRALGAAEEALAAAGGDPIQGARVAATAAHAALGRLRVAIRRRDAGQESEALARFAPLVDSVGVIADERAWLARKEGDLDAAERELAVATPPDAPAPALAAALSTKVQRARLAAGGEATVWAAALEALADDASDPSVQAMLLRRAGYLMLGAGRSGDGVARLERAAALAPSDPESVVILADVAGGADALAARIAGAAPALQSTLRLERAEALEREGRLAEAAEELRRVLVEDPRHVPALEALRALAARGGDREGGARVTARLAGAVLDGERSAALYVEAGRAFSEIGRTREAAACYRAVLDRTPHDGASYQRARQLLGELYAADKQPGALVELLSHRLKYVDDFYDARQLLVERAELLAAHGDADGAERDLRAVLDRDPDDVEALGRLAELCAARPAARAEALQLFGRYVELERDAAKRRPVLRRMAELEEAAGRPEQAAARLEAAIEQADTRPESVGDRERLVALFMRQRLWQRAIDELRRIGDLTHEPTARAQLEIRVAGVYLDGFGDPKSAVGALERALVADPLSMEALERLVALTQDGHLVRLDLDDRLDRAVAVARARAIEAPLDPQRYQALVRLWGWRGDDDAQLLAAQARAIVAGEVPLPRDDAFDPTRELSVAGWERLLPPEARSVALDIWRALGDATTRLYGPTLEAAGAAKGDRLNAKVLPPQWAHVDKLARALGCVGYELYAGRDADTCRAAGAALVVGSAFAGRLSPVHRFRAARALALVRDRLGVVEELDAEELAVLFAASARVAEVSPPAVVRAAPEARVEERARALGKALDRKQKRALAAIGPRFAELPLTGVWKRAISDGATRAALAVGGDLGAALTALGIKSVADDERARALLTFVLGEDYATLRRELGLRS